MRISRVEAIVLFSGLPNDFDSLGIPEAGLMQELLGMPGIKCIEIPDRREFLVDPVKEADWVELKPLIVAKLRAVLGKDAGEIVVDDTT